MKTTLKLSALFILPLAMTAMFGNTAIGIIEHYSLFEAGENYLPFVCALSFFSFVFFFCMTANLLYPAHMVALPIKQKLSVRQQTATERKAPITPFRQVEIKGEHLRTVLPTKLQRAA